MTKIIEFQEEKEPLVVSEFRTEFHIMNVFSFLFSVGLMIVGFYFSTKQESVYSYEMILGLLGLFLLIIGIIDSLKNSLVVWTFYENEVVVKSIYIKRQISFNGNQIVDYKSHHERSQFETGESDGYKHFSFLVKFDENAEPEEFSIDQFTFTNFFEMRQAILDMADYKNEEE